MYSAPIYIFRIWQWSTRVASSCPFSTTRVQVPSYIALSKPSSLISTHGVRSTGCKYGLTPERVFFSPSSVYSTDGLDDRTRNYGTHVNTKNTVQYLQYKLLKVQYCLAKGAWHSCNLTAAFHPRSPLHMYLQYMNSTSVHVLSVEVGTVHGCSVHVHVYVHRSFRSSLRINLIWEEMNDGFLDVEPHLNHHRIIDGDALMRTPLPLFGNLQLPKQWNGGE
jgi:hypothetical protein